ncbi:MAG: ferrochelatase [Proteobacteria bacterium]|nr:ferrochelatase [Pseudomonadota bacterium]
MADAKGRIGILLVNLGSPERPESRAIRRYLREFLSDPRVMDIPFIARWLILNLFILPFRPGRIVEKYRRIWSSDGFPLLVYGRRLVRKLADRLGDGYRIELAMRYGSPSIAQGLANLQRSGIDELLVLPLFPQYASATTGSVLEKVFGVIEKWPVIPGVTGISSFYDHSEFIRCWVDKGKSYWEKTPDHVLFSFHGLPESQIRASDRGGEYCLKSRDCCGDINPSNVGCYRAQCIRTAEKIAHGLRIPPADYTVSFQSRLGKTLWIQPYTSMIVAELARKEIKHLLVFCPSFVADCLETSEEILIQEANNFRDNGGETLTMVPSLNDDEQWVDAVRSMIEEKTG